MRTDNSELEGMPEVEDSLSAPLHSSLCKALNTLPPRPEGSAKQAEKKRYSEQMSSVLAVSIADQLRQKGMKGIRPSGPGDVGLSGAERRLSGGLAAKKVDVSWSTEESGLILGVSIKCITTQDAKTKNFQKNLTNRRNDMLIEAVSLHRRFPFSTLLGMLFLDSGAEADGTTRRKSTFENSFPKTRLFTGRIDPSGRDEQFEKLYIASVSASPQMSQVRFYEANESAVVLAFDEIIADVLNLVAERNFDFYEIDSEGKLAKI